MASRKDNLKSLFSNTKTRVIIIFTAFLMIFAVVIGYLKLKSVSVGEPASVTLSSAPTGMRSIPGALEPTAQYAKLQEQQNVTQAQKAVTSGGSAIPTIIRTQTIGEGVGVIGSKNGQAGVGFSALAQEGNLGEQRTAWIHTLKNGSCSKKDVQSVVSEGAQLSDLRPTCSCVQLKDVGYTLKDLEKVCQCKELKASGYSARDLKEKGYTARRLRDCGFSACELRAAGFTALEMKDAGFSDDELKGAGFSAEEINQASGLPAGITAADIRNAGCSVDALTKLRKAGVKASAIRRISGCSLEQLKAAGYTAGDLYAAGFTAAEMKKAGFSDEDLKNAGYSDADIKAAGGGAKDCSIDSLKKARQAGITALEIRKTRGCSAKALKDAGYTAKELKDAGFSAAELKDAGFSAKELKDAGFSAKELKDAGFSLAELKAAGFSLAQLKDAGFSDAELKAAGFTIPGSQVAALIPQNNQQPAPAVVTVTTTKIEPNAAGTQQLQDILQKQNQQMAEQKYDQKIQQRTSEMLSSANQSIQEWKKVTTQVYTESSIEEKLGAAGVGVGAGHQLGAVKVVEEENIIGPMGQEQKAIIKTGDVLFAVMDTSVNSDEPGPILATIVSGKLKGTKLIGSFNLPANSNKMVITFNTMSIPGAAKTTSISAYAIDPNTARTALSSKTNHHYLMRYGSLFASSFLQGFGNAFQSANTTVTIGGTGGGNDITVQNGINRSNMQNAIIALATVGKAWGQQVQQVFNTPTTVEVYSGTGVGILFTQDVVI